MPSLLFSFIQIRKPNKADTKNGRSFSRRGRRLARALMPFALFFLIFPLPALPAGAAEDEALAEARKALPVESNSYQDWPLGPIVAAQSAILMEADTGAVIYAKNIHEKLYPASITKLLTAYIALQECEPQEMITFSAEAVGSIDWREDANMGVNPGASLPLEDVLYGVLVGSANEAAYALAEHISGSIEGFAQLMNETARELGCTGSYFANPNGIHQEDHYTTAHDMALIAQAFFSQELLSRISGTASFEVPVTETQAREGLLLTAKSLLLPGRAYAYDSLIGSKTGYTEAARQTLVSCAAKNGMKLICVVMQEEAPDQYTDTAALFDYGFDNFEAVKIEETDSEYMIGRSFFAQGMDLLGSSSPIMELDPEDYLLLPHTLTLEDLEPALIYEDGDEETIASIEYSWQDIPLGRISLILAVDEPYVFDFSSSQDTGEGWAPSSAGNIVFINLSYIFVGAFALSALAILFFLRRTKRRRQKGPRYGRRRRFRLFGRDGGRRRF